MTIKNVTRVLLDREIKRAQGEDTQKVSKNGDVKHSIDQSVDIANISSEAKEVHASKAGQSAKITSTGNLGKATSINEVISRIQEGYYEQPAVIEEIASSIINSENLRSSEHEPSRFGEINKKIDQGFYNGKDVIETVATKLLEFLK